MKQLPATVIEAGALAFARAEFEWFRTNRIKMFGIDVCVLDEADSRRLAVRALQVEAMRSAKAMADLADYARAGWGLADETLRDLIMEHQNNHIEMPTILTNYNIDIVRGLLPSKIPGQDKADNFLRDLAICVVVSKTVETSRLRPTRAPYSSRPSGCSIVAQVLEMSEQAIVTIWNRYGRLNLPIQLPA